MPLLTQLPPKAPGDAAELEPSSIASQVHQQRARLEVEQLGLEPAGIWDIDVTGRSSTFYN